MQDTRTASGRRPYVARERNTQVAGRSGSGTIQKKGPAARGNPSGNRTMGGGVNRRTKGL